MKQSKKGPEMLKKQKQSKTKIRNSPKKMKMADQKAAE